MLGVNLVACSDVGNQKTPQQLKTELVNLNQLLRVSAPETTTTNILPYTDEYLKARHEIYTQLAEQVKTSEVNYLLIGERFPQRYLPWPVQSDLAKTIHKMSNAQQDSWFNFVSLKLAEAAESKIRLTQFEYNELVKSIENSRIESAAALALLKQLKSYIPRSRLGIDQVTNGSDWYQSKLNYFAGSVNKPLDWMQIVSIKLAEEHKVAPIALNYSDWSTALVQQFVMSQCDSVAGYDWQFHYQNVYATTEQCSLQLDADSSYFWATLMMLDLGLHYQGWNQQLAETFLAARVNLDDETMRDLIHQIALFPSSVFVLMQKM